MIQVQPPPNKPETCANCAEHLSEYHTLPNNDKLCLECYKQWGRWWGRK